MPARMMAKNELFLGVDGGGTGCRARLSDAAGVKLAEAQAGAANIRFGVRQLAAGATWQDQTGDHELCLVLLAGEATVTWDGGKTTHTLGPRASVFEGYPHAVYRDGSGRPVVETYTISGMGHGQPIDPGSGPRQCGTPAAYILDVDICAAWYLGHGWGLDA